MPTYVYACKACDHRFEQYQTFTEDSLTVCPECQGALRKVFNSVGVVFKGSGFYRNDARGGKTNNSALLPAESAGSQGGSDAATQPASPSDSSASTSKATASDATKNVSTPTKRDAARPEPSGASANSAGSNGAK